VQNLFSNAIKFSPEHATISLLLRVEDGYAIIEVIDSGQGIAPQDFSHLFERFKRGKSGQIQPGAGLGLSFVKTVASQHA
jgi:signal transduction histidine kinase